MTEGQAFALKHEAFSVREDILVAFRRAWDHIASPGSGWTGQERVAIAKESRDAWNCALCRKRKEALSPNMVEGEHPASELLPAYAVEAVHRITTDPARLTESGYRGLLSEGLSDSQYVESIGVVGTVTSIDTFCRSLGLPMEPLPEARVGDATGYRPERLKAGGSWLPLLMENDLAEAEKDMYGGLKQGANVLRCMSLVPDEVRNLLHIAEAMYMSDRDVSDFRATAGRAISRDQIELLASRVSIVNECFY